MARNGLQQVRYGDRHELRSVRLARDFSQCSSPLFNSYGRKRYYIAIASEGVSRRGNTNGRSVLVAVH